MAAACPVAAASACIRHQCIGASGSSGPFGVLRLFVVPVVSLRVGIKEVSEQEEKNKKKNKRNNQSVGEASVPRNSKAN